MKNNNFVRQALSEIAGEYTVIVDATCRKHGGKNFAYQNRDENFERQESICEGCTSPQRSPASAEVQQARAERANERPERPSKR